MVASPYAIVEKRRKRGGCGPFEISVTPSTHIQLRRKRGVGVLHHRVLLVRIDRAIHTLRHLVEFCPEQGIFLRTYSKSNFGRSGTPSHLV
jgi:hypothetical protein